MLSVPAKAIGSAKTAAQFAEFGPKSVFLIQLGMSMDDNVHLPFEVSRLEAEA